MERKRSMNGIKKLMCVLLAFVMTMAFIPGGFASPDKASADSRIVVSAIEGTSDMTTPCEGASLEKAKPTFTITKGTQAKIPQYMMYWEKKNNKGEWDSFDSGNFSAGTWRLVAKVTIDGDPYGSTHVLGNPITAKFDGQMWEVNEYPTQVGEDYSFTYIYSPEMFVEAESFDEEFLTLKLYGYDDIKATWMAQSDVPAYKVYYRESTSKVYKYKGRTTKTYMLLPNMRDGVKYFVKVVPDVEEGVSTEWGSMYGDPIYTLKKLNTPTVTKRSSSKVTVKWNNIYGETGYQISKSTSKTKTGVIYTVKTTTGKSKIISAKKGKTYYYKVRAYKKVDGKGIYGPWSKVRAYKLK